MRGTFYLLLCLLLIGLWLDPGMAGRWFARAQSAYIAERGR